MENKKITQEKQEITEIKPMKAVLWIFRDQYTIYGQCPGQLAGRRMMIYGVEINQRRNK